MNNFKNGVITPTFLFYESVFLLRFKANNSPLLSPKIAWLLPRFFVDSNSPCKGLFLHGPNLKQKPLHLVGTIFKNYFYIMQVHKYLFYVLGQ